MARLILGAAGESPEGAEQHELGDGIISVGRSDDNAIVLGDASVSRHHAQLTKTGEGYVLKDLGSANGTFVNNHRTVEQLLRDGDVILFGRFKMTFSDPAEVDAGSTVLFDIHATPPTPPEQEAAPGPAAAPAPTPPPPAAPAAKEPTEPHAPQAPQVAAPTPPPQAPPAAPAASPPAPSPPPPAPAVPPVAPPPPAPPATSSGAVRQVTFSSAARPAVGAGGPAAGFWIRLGAYLIDAVIVGVGIFVVTLIFTGISLLLRKVPALMAVVLFLEVVIALAAGLGYFLYFWATQGATPGKKMLGLQVVRQDGVEPLGYGKAALRLVGYICSSILYIGFIMIAFTDGNLGLHDMIAGTRVVSTK
ncbi:MAG: RDD family protein [Acidobacteria bacterium]|nr:RDD family protein [Acidobacteriota bacterium]